MPEAKKHVAEAYKIFVSAMGADYPIETRMDAAREVLNRLCGKPAQSVVVSGDEDSDPVQHSAPVAEKIANKAASEIRDWQTKMMEQLASLTAPPPMEI